MKVRIVEAVDSTPKQTIDLNLGAYTSDGAVIYAYVWKQDGETASNQTWVKLTEFTTVDVPTECNRIIIVRKAPGSEGNWESGVWNQSEDMVITAGKVLTFSGTWHKDGDNTKPSVFTWETPAP